MHYHVRTILLVLVCGGVIALWSADIVRKLIPAASPQQEAPRPLDIPAGAQELTGVPAYDPPAYDPHVQQASATTLLPVMAANSLGQASSISQPTILTRDAQQPLVVAGTTLLKDLSFQASVKVTTSQDPTQTVVFFLDQNASPLTAAAGKDANGITTWTAMIAVPFAGDHRVVAAIRNATTTVERSLPALVRIRTSGPSVQSVQPQNLALSTGHKTITVRFNADNPLDVTTKDGNAVRLLKPSNFVLKPHTGSKVSPTNVEFNHSDNSVTLTFANAFAADNYTLTIEAGLISDVFGNAMDAPYSTPLFMPVGGEVSTVSRGISGPTGANVEFTEFTPPRKILSGFNPSDRVETRISRLYYYRDAHRVAQIINRDVKSYNRAAVDMHQQLADKARTIADQATDDRRGKERAAVEAAKKTREAEREQEQAEQAAQSASNLAFEAAQPRPQLPGQPPVDPGVQTQQVQDLQKVADAARARAQAAREKVEALREKEIETNEAAQVATAVEDRARDNQFRREVAAANADPDTYAPGKPESQDPVRQVSVSVIGEGLIHLRGPIKGINVIRTMINQIDAPVGQVRVSVHTVQINGEKGDRMEKVAAKIQRFVDHSRFLTLQSAEMFRKAIVQVAAQKAVQLNNMPGLTQAERDRKYLYAFFGQDFIAELEAMDSEFLHTGNKLLSIHSMDSTSLASAMFIMALAKNSTRMEILQTFESMMQHQLPVAEQNYFEAGWTSDGKQRLFGRNCRREEFQLLSENARFQSIKGMFNVEIIADDTMTPFQRDFVKLAQIFKSRLIVEMELKQRVMERSVIEERLGGDPLEELREAKAKEVAARQQAEQGEKSKQDQVTKVLGSSALVRGRVSFLHTKTIRGLELAASLDISDKVKEQLVKQLAIDTFRVADGLLEDAQRTTMKNNVLQNALRELDQMTKGICAENRSITKWIWDYKNRQFDDVQKAIFDLWKKAGFKSDEFTQSLTEVVEEIKREPIKFELPSTVFGIPVTIEIIGDNELKMSENHQATVAKRIEDGFNAAQELRNAISVYRFRPVSAEKLRLADDCLKNVTRKKNEELNDLFRLGEVLSAYSELAGEVEAKADQLLQSFRNILAALSGQDELDNVYAQWVGLHSEFKENFETKFLEDTRVGEMDEVFSKLIEVDINRRAFEENAAAFRRPLDHKKFLDMLIDEMEDKYIELLEGTRAHTANIDAYIKRLMTSLDDDFNTQFYYPTFRKVREASQMWDVQMGQVETTNVLANNRAFAKVTPEATMEFDLPKRDILITEAMNGAKAMVQDFGALAQDPTFLSMAKLGSGAPTSTQFGGANGGQSTVRNVLPAGLSTSTAETVMGQQGPGGNQFGSAMESLIPDPAIYKFETGTGWEIRPVIQPDGQSVVFDFDYLYTTNVREPVRADEKHLGRVKRHQVSTDVQLSNFELREISRYTVALKASRTSRGVPLLEDIPVLGVMFRPQPSQESSLQQNVILGQSTIFPTLFDLMGLRWAPVVADLDPLRLSNDEFIVRSRRRALMNRVFDQSSSQVDQFLRIPDGERRMDLYRSQETIPSQHPNGYQGPGANLRDSQLREGFDTGQPPQTPFIPSASAEGSRHLPQRRRSPTPTQEIPPANYDGQNIQPGQIRPGTILQGPVYEGPIHQGPIHQGPIHEGPIHQGPVYQSPAGPVLRGPLQAPYQPQVPPVHVHPQHDSREDIGPPRRVRNPKPTIAPIGYFRPTAATSAANNARAAEHTAFRLRRLPPIEPRPLAVSNQR